MRKASTTSIATVIGTTSENAAMPTAGTSTRRISSVAYAEDERLSDANTASAVGRPKRSCSSSSVRSGGPSSFRFSRYPLPSVGSSTDATGVEVGTAVPWGRPSRDVVWARLSPARLP